MIAATPRPTCSRWPSALGEDVDLRLVALQRSTAARDTIVSVGHVVGYLPDVAAIEAPWWASPARSAAGASR